MKSYSNAQIKILLRSCHSSFSEISNIVIIKKVNKSIVAIKAMEYTKNINSV